MSKYYIGLATSAHDPAIAIINESGQIIYTESSERHYQIKIAAGCPPDNQAWTEKIMELYCSDGDNYVITKSWSNKFSRRLQLFHASYAFHLLHTKPVQKIIEKILGRVPLEFEIGIFSSQNDAAVKLSASAGIRKFTRTKNINTKISSISYDHHLSHAGLCYCAPFNEATCLVADGTGENGSFSIFKYKNGKISLLESLGSSASMGFFYGFLTYACGFRLLEGEEWKVMGLAAYGSFKRHIYDLFKSMYIVQDCKIQKQKNSATVHSVRSLQNLIAVSHKDPLFKADLAYNGQLAYCEWMSELLTNIHKKYPSDNLILTGGCALNSSYNGQILDKTPFKNLYVPSAPADDGCALGGALLAYYNDHPHTESIHKNITPYLGSEITDEKLQNFLQFGGQKVRKVTSDKYDTVARLLADGKIIGWVQGKAEFGPRALGNRSILADPRNKNIKDRINERVKFREEFRPFAPSILHEYGDEYFEHYQESHYMERTLTFRIEVRDKVPGVVHEDGTGRLQTVKEEWNKEFHHLLKSFHGITGVPILLNTSFNVMGKPIIHSVEDALATFLTSGLDALVINDYLIEK